MTDSPYPLTRATIERAREALMTRQVQELGTAASYVRDKRATVLSQHWADEAEDTQRAIDALSQLIAEGMYRDE